MAKPIPPATATATATVPPAYTTDYHGTPPWLHAASLGAAVLAPVGLLLPPRRMGVRSLLLAAGAFFATSQLAYDYTGHSLYQRFRRRADDLAATQQQDLPAAALQRQAAMRAERERRRQQQQQLAAASDGGSATDKPAEQAADPSAQESALRRLWMGSEKEDWVRERARRERETLETGGGYWDLIVGQISEVVADLRGKGGGGGGGGGDGPGEDPKKNT